MLAARLEVADARRKLADAGREGLHFDVEVGEVDLDLEIGRERLELAPQLGDLAREPAAESVDGRFESERGLGLHDVEHGLGLIERDAAVLERSLRELAPLGQARASGEEAVEHGARGGESAVAADLDRVFPRVGARRTQERDEDFVDGSSVGDDVPVVDGVRCLVGEQSAARRTEDAVGDRDSVGTADAHEADPAFADRGRDRGDRVPEH